MKLNKKIGLLFAVIPLCFTLAACGTSNTSQTNSSSGSSANGTKGTITVGGKDFTEQRVFEKLTAIYLKAKGYQVKEVPDLGSSVARNALEHGQINLYWEYTGTSLVVYNKQKPVTNPQKAYEDVKKLDASKDLTWLNQSQVNDTYAILMTKSEAQKDGISSLSDLANYVKQHPDFKFATDNEFYGRADGLPGLEKQYNLQFKTQNIVRMDAGLVYNALKNGQVGACMGLSTDGRIKAFNLVVLNDDKEFFPAYYAAPVVQSDVLKKNPGLEQLLNSLSGDLNSDAMTELNYEVDVEHKDLTQVADDWLTTNHLI